MTAFEITCWISAIVISLIFLRSTSNSNYQILNLKLQQKLPKPKACSKTLSVYGIKICDQDFKNFTFDDNENEQGSESMICRSVINENKLKKLLLLGPKNLTIEPPVLPQLSDSCQNEKKVQDVIIFSTELDTLEIRLHELNQVVDQFHIIESNFDFHGAPFQPIFATAMKFTSRFDKFKDKIQIHTLNKTYPQYSRTKKVNSLFQKRTWSYEKAKTDFAIEVLHTLDNSSLAIIGHVDEIPKHDIIHEAKFCDFNNYSAFFSFFIDLNLYDHQTLPIVLSK